MSAATAFVIGAFAAASNACSDEFGRATSEDAEADVEIDAGADAEPPYPNPPYGLRKGSTIRNLVLNTRVPPSTEWVDKPLSDYYDPFGKKGIYGIAIEVVGAAGFSSPVLTCIEQMTVRWPIYDGRGAKLMAVLIGANATKAEGNRWFDKFKIPFAFALDPDSPDGGIGLSSFPTHFFINPRTMKIVETSMGTPGTGCVFSPELDALLDSNNAPNPF